MFRHIFTPILLSALALARPQTPADTSALAGLPACAQDAANAALGSSGCASNDKTCICSSQPFIAAITTAVTQTCTAQDVQAALVFAQTYCGAALSAGGGGQATSSAPSESATPTPAPTGTDDAYSGSTTTVPGGTVTSMTSVAGATDISSSVSTIPPDFSSSTVMSSSGAGGNGSMTTMTTQCTTTTTTVMTTGGVRTGAYNATYTGAAIAVAGQGMLAAAIGVAGAVALL